jgi:UDP-sugar pyrophosphorylase
MQKFGCKKFIFSSTAALFGQPDRVPIQPDDPTRPESPYGDTKLIIEWLLKSCHVAYGTRYVCLRYFNACGADASGEIGERHEPETHLIPVVLEAALGKRKQLSIFGTDFPTKDGTAVRDYIHVTDLATAHIRALEYLCEEKNPPNHFNLGTGVGSTVLDVVTAVETVTGRKLPVKMAGRREGDPAILVADASKANTILRWKAKYGLVEMVRTAWNFHFAANEMDILLAPHKAQHKELFYILHDIDQMHLFQKWSPLGKDEDKKEKFFQQLELINKSYSGGLRKYFANAQALLAKTRDGYNPWVGYLPSVPTVKDVNWESSDLDSVESEALTLLPYCGFVLVAGGLGERLGYNGIKIELPYESLILQSHLEYYVKFIRAWGAKSADGSLPLCIMTSDDTHGLTVKLLDRLKLTGFVTLVKQEKVPAVTNNHARMCLTKESPYVLDTKPHGSGDVHTLLYSSGTAKTWASKGLTHIVFFQDTNSLAMRGIPYAVGYCANMRQDMVFMCIPRTPGSAIGCVVNLRNSQTGANIMANVEYNVLDAFLKSSSANGVGDVAGANGLSPYPGNTNTLVVRLAPYVDALARTHGAVPEYVAPKYGKTQHVFKTPARVECTMEDISQLMPDASKVSAVSFPTWMCFNPVKNNIEDAAAKVRGGLPPWSAYHAEADVYGYNTAVLRWAGATVGQSTKHNIGTLETQLPPRVILCPSWAPIRNEARKKIRSPVDISGSSTLVLNGRDITLDNVRLDGVLIINTVPGARVVIKDVQCKSLPWLLTTADKNSDAIVGVKGFRVVKRDDAVVLTYPSPGTFVYNGKQTPSKL